MEKKIVAIDMDEVLADFLKKELRIYEEEFGVTYTPEDLNGHELYQVVPEEHRDIVYGYPHRPGFFRDLEVMQDSQEVVAELQEKYEVFVVSAAMEFRDSLVDKRDWLGDHFPSISWKHVVFCGFKHIIRGDYLIDDRADNLKFFFGQPLLFSAPHNLKVNSFQRVENWKAVANYLL